MAVSNVSSSTVAATYSPPPAQQKSADQASQATAATTAAKKDTVSISSKAQTPQQLPTDGDTLLKEAQETAIQKAVEKTHGLT